MPEPDNFEHRLNLVETQLVHLRAHTSALNALRETQLEQGQVLEAHGRAIDELGRAVDAQGQATAAGFAKVNAGMTEIKDILDRLVADQN